MKQKEFMQVVMSLRPEDRVLLLQVAKLTAAFNTVGQEADGLAFLLECRELVAAWASTGYHEPVSVVLAPTLAQARERLSELPPLNGRTRLPDA